MSCEKIHAPLPTLTPPLATMPLEVREAWNTIVNWMTVAYSTTQECPECGEKLPVHTYTGIMSPTPHGAGFKLAVGFRGLTGPDGTTYIGLR